MHLVLKRRAQIQHANPAKAFRDFQAEFNHTRPHEALKRCRADLYTPSPRPFPKTLKPITYPGHFEKLASAGPSAGVSRLLAGHDVGLKEVDHFLINVYFGPIWLGRFVEPKHRIFDSLGRGEKKNWWHLQRTENCYPGLLT